MAFILEGKLLKRGSVSWKSRHFVLGETSIQYFAKADDASVRGELALSSESELIDFSKRPFGFAIITGDKSLTVAASCAEEEIEWRAAIEEALELLRQNGTHKNSDGWHVVSAAGQDFEMSTKYELIKAIGHGAYGVVVSAIDHSSDSKVAIKKIPDTFEDLVDAKRIVREIHLLRSFDHDNVIRVVDLFTPQPYDDFNDVYIVSDLLDTDLHRVIYSQQPLTSEHIQYFLYQMLCGLNYIHSAGVIHRDLKPSNILMNANCDLRICDFGLSRGISSSDEHGDGLTEYVVTRWYRAPEIMLSCPSYDSQIDVWSMGAIFGEMLGRKPMFPGSDYIHQLKLIMKVVGTPSEEGLYFVTNQKARRFVMNLPRYEPVDLVETYPNRCSEAGADLLRQMLVLDPNSRISVQDALAHEYFKDVRDEACESLATAELNWGDIETCELTKVTLQNLLLSDFEALESDKAKFQQAPHGSHTGPGL